MKKLNIAFLFVSFFLSGFAQPGSIDLSFNSTDIGNWNGDLANNIVNTATIQSNGKTIIGGDFTSYNGTVRNRIARLNNDGSLDTSFNPGTGADFTVNNTSIQIDGKIIIGGDFTSYNGTVRNRIARLNPNGSLDTSFNPGTGANITVSNTFIQSDGKIIICGYFTSYNGTSRNRIARLNSDGSLDTSFNPGTGANYEVLTISIQNDGKIIVGGNFTSYNGTIVNRIARLNADGSLDTSFNPGTGAGNFISASTIQNDGKIIIVGDFTSYNGTVRNRIARLNTDGSLDASFNPGTGSNNIVRNSSIQSDGKINICGYFTSYNGTLRNRIARLNTDGSLDTSFNPGTGVNDEVLTNSIQNDGKIIICGYFTSYNGTVRNRIARLNIDGSIDNSFIPGTGANNYVVTTSIQIDGKIIIGGDFTSYNGTVRNRIARLNIDGSLDTSFNPGTGADIRIQTSSIQNDGKIIVGGSFTSYNGTDRNRIARLNTDGSLDASFNPGTGANDEVKNTSIQNDSKIIICGYFTSYNGIVRNRIARLNTDGSLDTSFNPGTGANGFVLTTSIQNDGKIIIAGDFTSYNGTVRNRIARLNSDGSLDASFNPGTGADIQIQTNSIQNDGKIIVGGAFTYYNGTVRNRIARINTDGSLDTSFNPGTGSENYIGSISIQNDGKIIIGGGFNSYNGFLRNRIARLDTNGSLDTSFNPGTGLIASYVLTTNIQIDGKIIIGGTFTSYNGIGKNRIARINGGSVLSNPLFNLSNTVIYPNPSNGNFTLQINDLIGTKNIEVYTLIGQRIYFASTISDETVIDITNQPKGIYLYKISNENGKTISGKLVKE